MYSGEPLLREEAAAIIPREQFCHNTCDGCFEAIPGEAHP